MSAIQIFRDSKLIALSHLIGLDQLPNRLFEVETVRIRWLFQIECSVKSSNFKCRVINGRTRVDNWLENIFLSYEN